MVRGPLSTQYFLVSENAVLFYNDGCVLLCICSNPQNGLKSKVNWTVGGNDDLM